MEKSIWHNKIHLEMAHGLINDPNGLCYENGTYHIFYQWNPYTCEHKNKHWGYTKTTDFINYTTPQIALSPIDDFDKNGCYSGSARIHNNHLELFYTANLKDEHNIRYPKQILAIRNDDNSFTKEKVIIESVPKGYTTHFRDPYIFKYNNRSFIIIGAQRENLTGCCLIYEEINSSWQFKGELKTNYTNFGYMWECPNLIQIDGYDVLLFCPQGLDEQGDNYNNLYQSGYIIGKFNPDTLEFKHGEFKELDRGFDFYAPQVLVTKERKILIGWIGMPEKEHEYPTMKEGWLHSLTLPRQLFIKNNTLYQIPIKELDDLSIDKQSYTGTVNTVSTDIYTPSKIILDIELDDTNFWQGKLKLLQEEFILSYDKCKQKFCIDRTNLTLGGKGKRYFDVAYTHKLHLEIFFDTSVVELYCLEGEICATACYYFPQKTEAIPKFIMSTDINKKFTFEMNVISLKHFQFN